MEPSPDVGLLGHSEQAIATRRRRFAVLKEEVGGFDAAYSRLRDEHARGRFVLARIQGIGQGRALAAERQRRFLAWMMARWHALPRYVTAMMSPEQALAERPARYFVISRVIERAGMSRWLRRWERTPQNEAAELRFVAALLASPEWASLPWQQEPSEGPP